MHKKSAISTLVLLPAMLLLTACSSAQRRADDVSASGLMDEAKTLYDQQRLGRAASLFKKLSDRDVYDDVYASEATFFLGECYYQRKNYVDAHYTYKGLLDKFRRCRQYDVAVDREFIIGGAFCSGKVSTFWKGKGWGAKVLLEALKYRPFGRYAAEAQMVLGDYYMAAHEFDDALHHYDLLVSEYPETPEGKQAIVRRADCLFESVQGNRYDSEEVKRAVDGLEGARKALDAQQPRSAVVEQRLSDVTAKLNELHEVAARENYDTGTFFRRNGKMKAAAAYYHAVLQEAPESSYAVLAQKALDGIRQEK